jgi:hypothetical protein
MEVLVATTWTLQRLPNRVPQWLPEVRLGELHPLDLPLPQVHRLRRRIPAGPHRRLVLDLQELAQPGVQHPSPPLGARPARHHLPLYPILQPPGQQD